MAALLPSVEADSASQRPGVTLIQPQVVPEAGSGQPLEGRPRRSFSVERQVVLEDEDPEPDGRDDIDPFTRLPVETMLLNIASLVFLLMKTWQTNIPSP